MPLNSSHRNPWTPREDAQLRRLAAEGWTAAMIGREVERSRNSVVSRAHRTGVALRVPSGGAGTLIAARLKARATSKPPRGNTRPTRPARPPERRGPGAPPTPIVEEVVNRPLKRLLDLQGSAAGGPGGDCRWPIGDPRAETFGFCGLPRTGHGPYCPHHTKIGSTPTKTRARDACN